MKKKSNKPDDQLTECVSQINASHEAVTFSTNLVAKHGKESIKHALNCGKFLKQAEIIVRQINGKWIKWCKEKFPKISYSTIQRYMVLYANWSDVTNKDKEDCETLNQAYLLAEVTSEPKETTSVKDANRTNGKDNSGNANHNSNGESVDGWHNWMYSNLHDNVNECISKIVCLQNRCTMENTKVDNEKIAQLLLPIRTWLKTMHCLKLIKPWHTYKDDTAVTDMLKFLSKHYPKEMAAFNKEEVAKEVSVDVGTKSNKKPQPVELTP